MDDDGFDPCECIWNHEVAMRRLLSLLRQGQSYCTDSECVDDLPATQNLRGDMSGMFFMMICWLVLVVALYMMRPNSLRGDNQDRKPNNQDHQGPPAPPALM